MSRIEEILSTCIEDIREGKATLESCLERYPSVRDKLEPLLKVALSIQESPDIKPSDAFKTRARVELIERIHAEKVARKSYGSILGNISRPIFSSQLLRTLSISFAVLVFIATSGAGVAYASQDSLPGDNLYSVKLGTEELRRLLESDDIAEVELELSFAETRLREMEKLADSDISKAAIPVALYEKNIEMAIEKAGQDEENLAGIKLENASLNILRHISILDGIEDRVPEAAGEVVRQCQEIAVTGQLTALNLLAQQDPQRSTEININVLSSRLQKANETADRGEARKTEEALQQYLQFHDLSEEILQIALRIGFDPMVINELNRQAMHKHEETLNNMHGKVSEELMGIVKGITGVTAEDQSGEGGISDSSGKNGVSEKPDDPADGSDGGVGEPSDTGEPGNGAGDPSGSTGEPNGGPGQPGGGAGEPGSGSGQSGNGKN